MTKIPLKNGGGTSAHDVKQEDVVIGVEPASSMTLTEAWMTAATELIK